MNAEAVSGRDQPRWTGEPVIHDVRFYGADRRPGITLRPGDPLFWARGVVAECEPCGWTRTFDPGHTAAELLERLIAQHAGIEDP
jgi:hypothetical protein